MFWKWFSALRAVVRLLAGALCRGGTSESVRMLREMAVGEVGRLRWLLYPDMLVVVVGTEVPTTCFRVCVSLVWLVVWIACYAGDSVGRLSLYVSCCRSGL